jgi:hypothetical protein
MNTVPTIAFNMRIDDDHHFTALGSDVLLHLYRVGEGPVVPREVPLSICVLDIQPDHIISCVVKKRLTKTKTKQREKKDGGRRDTGCCVNQSYCRHGGHRLHLCSSTYIGGIRWRTTGASLLFQSVRHTYYASNLHSLFVLSKRMDFKVAQHSQKGRKVARIMRKKKKKNEGFASTRPKKKICLKIAITFEK